MGSQEKVSEWQILKDEQLSLTWVKRKKAFQASTGLGQRHRNKTQLCLGNSMHIKTPSSVIRFIYSTGILKESWAGNYYYFFFFSV